MRKAFLVEVAQAEGAGAAFRGRAEHLFSGKVVHYQSAEELVAFIGDVLSPGAVIRGHIITINQQGEGL